MYYGHCLVRERNFKCQISRAELPMRQIEIGDSCIMMADEAPQMDAVGPEHYGGLSASLLIYTADCDAMYKQAVAAGARTGGSALRRSYVRRQRPFRLKMVDCYAHQGYVNTGDGEAATIGGPNDCR